MSCDSYFDPLDNKYWITDLNNWFKWITDLNDAILWSPQKSSSAYLLSIPIELHGWFESIKFLTTILVYYNVYQWMKQLLCLSLNQ